MSDCIPKDFGHGSFVCVCNSTYCDTLPPLQNPGKGKVLTVTSSKDKKRWQTEVLKLRNKKKQKLLPDVDVAIKLEESKTFQKILGFGGAFTDATGINLRLLPQELQDMSIK
ncbi:putative glucosylceramidase 4 [Armadillidium vulgare]|nr:putative glucosylceramidase 4 [Armadillidium vulgare]